MNEEEKIESSQEESKSESPQEVNENISPEQIIEQTESTIINEQPTTETMEVHHPHHVTHKKKWGEYLLEFLMLFLAVFLGFVAENIRERGVEKDREKEYMQSMLEDLKSDTALLSYTMKYWDNINNNIDSVSDAIQFPLSDGDLVKAYRHLTEAMNYYSFKFNDRTIAQLKNSGGFRLVRKENVANKIILYDQFNNNAAVQIAEQHSFLYNVAAQLKNKVFSQDILYEIFKKYRYNIPVPSDNKWIDSMIQTNKIPLPAENYSEVLFEFKNALLTYRQDYSNMFYNYDGLRGKMNELIQLIQKEYHLENE